MAQEERTLAGFDLHIKSTTDYLNHHDSVTGFNWFRLGLVTNDGGASSSEMNRIQQFHDQWYTGNPAAPGIYELHTNKNTKNPSTRVQVVKLMDDFNAYYNPLRVRMGVSPNITAQDRMSLAIANPDT